MGSNTNAATGNSMDVPSSWRGLSREESAKLALYHFRALANLTCRVSSDHSILEGGPLVQVVADHTRVCLWGHLPQA